MLFLSILSVFHKVWWIHTSMDMLLPKGVRNTTCLLHAGPCGDSRNTTLKPQSITGRQEPWQGEHDLQRSWKRHTMEEQLAVLELTWENLPFSRIPEGGHPLGKEKIDPWCGHFKTRPPIPWHSSHWEVGFMSSHHESEWACAVLTNEVWWKGCYMTSKVRSCKVMGFCPACWFTLGILSHVERLL